jgi:uncharacterized protein YndB with AHSA1/START domain
VGETKDAGWQIGVSFTIDQPTAHVWDRLVSLDGLGVWLGDGVELTGGPGQPYQTADGTQGEVRTYRPNDRVRLTWRPDGWDHETTVQVALADKGAKTGVRFHQERLSSAEERERQRLHWKDVAEKLRPLLES